MAIGLRRKTRLDSRRDNQKITRRKNGAWKNKERARRDARMAAKAKATPADSSYAPDVQSWLSRQLSKPFSKISADEIKQLVG